MDVLNFLFSSNQFEKTIFNNAIEFNQFSADQTEYYFENSSEIIVILELIIPKGEVQIQLDQPLEFGIILESKSMIEFIHKAIDSPVNLHYKFGSKSSQIIVSIVLFRPNDLNNQKVKTQISYSGDYSYEKESIAIDLTQNSQADSSKADILLYCLVALGSLVALSILICLVIRLRKVKKAVEDLKRKSDISNKPPTNYFKSKNLEVINSKTTNQEQYITEENIYPKDSDPPLNKAYSKKTTSQHQDKSDHYGIEDFNVLSFHENELQIRDPSMLPSKEKSIVQNNFKADLN